VERISARRGKVVRRGEGTVVARRGELGGDARQAIELVGCECEWDEGFVRVRSSAGEGSAGSLGKLFKVVFAKFIFRLFFGSDVVMVLLLQVFLIPSLSAPNSLPLVALVMGMVM
jgi:hypothetical protein